MLRGPSEQIQTESIDSPAVNEVKGWEKKGFIHNSTRKCNKIIETTSNFDRKRKASEKFRAKSQITQPGILNIIRNF